MAQLATQLPRGFWAVCVDDDMLRAIRDQRLPSETDDAVIWRLMTAAFPLQLLPDGPTHWSRDR